MGLDIQMLLYLFALQKRGGAAFRPRIEPAGVLYLPARDEILSAERNIPPEKLRREREKELRRSGLLLSEPEVLQAMEHEALQESPFPTGAGEPGRTAASPAPSPRRPDWESWGGMWTNWCGRSAGKSGTATSTRTPAATAKRTKLLPVLRLGTTACHFQDGRDGDHLRYILPVKAGGVLG